MRFRIRRFHAVPILGLLLMGCQSATDPIAHAPSGTDSPTPPIGAAASGGLVDAFAGIYEVSVDRQQLTVATRLLPTRTAQFPQALSYDLDIANFLKPDSLEFASVRSEPNGDLLFTYYQRHPFPAPDFALPITANNRADLGYTGRLLILADLEPSEEASHTWYGGDIKANTELVVNPQGYVNPGDLLSEASQIANTFPYLLIADDGKDNRLEVSNEGIYTGNYDPAFEGWQQANAGDPAVNWTGYDYLHGGQSVRGSLTLSGEALLDNAFTFRVAVLVKYTDPRGATGKSRRMPPATPDALAFSYRLPFAALDASVVLTEGPLFVSDTPGSGTGVTFKVRDWDTLAAEATDADLSDEDDVSLIQPGASGTPLALIDCPGLISTPSPILALPGWSGLPDDEIIYNGGLINDLGAAAGEYIAMLQITDPEALDVDFPTYHFGVDPVTVIPDASRAILPITYAPLNVTVVPTLTPPNWSTHFVGPSQRIAFEEDRTGIVSHNGNVAVAYQHGEIGNPSDSPELWLAQSTIPNPDDSTDWVLTPIDDGPIVGTWATLYNYNGRLIAVYLVYQDGFGALQDLGIALANSNTPTGVADWSRYVIEANGDTGRESTIGTLPDGSLGISYQNDPNWVRFARATTTNPTSAADWIISTADAPGLSGYATSWVNYQGGVAITHRAFSTGHLRMARSSDATPDVDSDWTQSVIDMNTSWLADFHAANNTMAVTSDDKLVVAYSDYGSKELRIALANTPDPIDQSSWNIYVLDSFGESAGDVDLEVVNGRLLLAYHYDIDPAVSSYQGGLKAARAAVPSPQNAGSWQIGIVDANNPPGTDAGHLPSVTVHNGQLWIAHLTSDFVNLGLSVSHSDTLW